MTANILLQATDAKQPVSSDCAGKSCTDNGAIGGVSANEILADLVRAKAVFQLRTIELIMRRG